MHLQTMSLVQYDWKPIAGSNIYTLLGFTLLFPLGQDQEEGITDRESEDVNERERYHNKPRLVEEIEYKGREDSRHNGPLNNSVLPSSKGFLVYHL